MEVLPAVCHKASMAAAPISRMPFRVVRRSERLANQQGIQESWAM